MLVLNVAVSTLKKNTHSDIPINMPIKKHALYNRIYNTSKNYANRKNALYHKHQIPKI